MARPHQGSIETGYGWVVVFASLAIHSIALGAPAILFVTLKPIAAALDAPRAVPSLAYSLMMIGAGAGGIFMGLWMDRRGILQPVLFGSAMVGIGLLVASQSEGKWSLYLANGLLIGLLGKSAMIAPLVANVTRWFDRRRGLAVAVIASGQGLSGAVWPPIIGYLNDAVGWRETYFVFGLFALATMLPLTLLLRPRPPVPPADRRIGIAARGDPVLGMAPLTVQAMLWLAVIGCCTAMAMPIVHLVSHATDLGHPASRAAEMLTLLFAAAFVSRIAFGMVADRIGAAPTLLIGSVCQAVMLAAFVQVEGLAGLYLCALLFGLGFAGIMPCYPLLIRLFFPVSEAGWRIASQYMFAAVGMAFGGWLAGAVFDLAGGYGPAFLVGIGFNLMNMALIGILFLRQIRLGAALRPV